MNTLLTVPELSRVTLYYREGNSNKVYQCAIEPAGAGFVVNFAYGRRGSTLNTGTKTSVPVDYAAARRLCEKLVREKKAKGYTEGPAGTPYQHSEPKVAGVLPQLLNPIGESELPDLLANDDWCAQEKFDGKRLLVRKQGAAIEGINIPGGDAKLIYEQCNAGEAPWTNISAGVREMMTAEFGIRYQGEGWLEIVDERQKPASPQRCPDFILTNQPLSNPSLN